MNKVVFITGASRGIGKFAALEFAKRGYKIFLTARNKELLSDLTQAIQKSGAEAAFAVCDVSNRFEVKAAIDQAIMHFARVDIALLNAGICVRCPMDQLDTDILLDTYQINLFGIAYGIEFLLPIMKKQSGGIIAGVSSLGESRGFPKSGIYSSSKAALSKFLEAARVELATYNIKVINIKPGFVVSDMTSKNDYYMPFLIDADRAAVYIADGIEKGKKIIAFPYPMPFLAGLVKLLPNHLYDYLAEYWNNNMRGK